jgi:hypothetical protein
MEPLSARFKQAALHSTLDTVIQDETISTLEKYEAFFKVIANLTLNHDVLSSINAGSINEIAAVTANKLGDALETIDKEWYNNSVEFKLNLEEKPAGSCKPGFDHKFETDGGPCIHCGQTVASLMKYVK